MLKLFGAAVEHSLALLMYGLLQCLLYSAIWIVVMSIASALTLVWLVFHSSHIDKSLTLSIQIKRYLFVIAYTSILEIKCKCNLQIGSPVCSVTAESFCIAQGEGGRPVIDIDRCILDASIVVRLMTLMMRQQDCYSPLEIQIRSVHHLYSHPSLHDHLGTRL